MTQLYRHTKVRDVQLYISNFRVCLAKKNMLATCQTSTGVSHAAWNWMLRSQKYRNHMELGPVLRDSFSTHNHAHHLCLCYSNYIGCRLKQEYTINYGMFPHVPSYSWTCSDIPDRPLWAMFQHTSPFSVTWRLHFISFSSALCWQFILYIGINCMEQSACTYS